MSNVRAFQSTFAIVAAGTFVALGGCVSAAARSTAPSTLELSLGKPIVIGHSFSIASTILHDERTINVQLPESYAKGTLRYPVVYLLDGGESEDFLHVAGIAQINAAYGSGQEVILVGIAGKDRRHDLTTPSSVASDLKAAPTSGGAADYRRFLVDEVKPWVDQRYRTTSRAALMGESLAGLFTLQAMISAPRSFTDYIAVSPSLWWNGGSMTHDLTKRIGLQRFPDVRLWVGFDMPPPPETEARKDRALQDELQSALDSPSTYGLSAKFVRLNETHSSIYHPAALQAFRDLFGKK